MAAKANALAAKIKILLETEPVRFARIQPRMTKRTIKLRDLVNENSNTIRHRLRTRLK
jgi:hypothetical protein